MEQQLKHRLVGATVLVTLAVIFIPMILSPPENTNEIIIDMVPPPEPGNTFRSRIVPLEGGKSPSEFEWPDIQERLNTEPGASGAPSLRTETETARPASKITREPERRPPPPKAAAREQKETVREPRKTVAAREPDRSRQSPRRAWAVQVGSFTEEKNALGLRDRLRAKGYRAFVKSVKEGGTTTTTRVFVGPTLRQEDAWRANKKLQTDLGIKGIVIRYSEGR